MFTYNIKDDSYSYPAGYITWGDFHHLHSKDEQLQGNLRKAPKITYQSLHPGNRKQEFLLHYPLSMKQQLQILKVIFQSKKIFLVFLLFFKNGGLFQIPNNNLVQINLVMQLFVMMKTTLFRQLANWIKLWQKSPYFTLSKQTSALITTLCSQALLIDELIEEGLLYVLTSQLQIDPIECRCSQYGQMSGERFLVSLLEVQHSEIILACCSLIEHVGL